jgi:eukaryotic-like serine/threonine-protein kinase
MIGRVIKGKFKIYDEIGAGGFATVYLGRNMDTNEIVAIKVLSDQYTREPRYVERFRREAGLAERLGHENVVRILDHGVEDGKHFLIMEFVEGLTLDTMLERRGGLPIHEAVSYLKQACQGLQAAHQAGVVHRDIKPANLMITPGGKIKIMDFGIARTGGMAGLTQSGMFMGTPRYISPEMARGAGADIRSDLYALGLLTYEMLTGKPPFDADNPWAVLRLQLEENPPPLHQVRPEVPAWLEAIVNRAISKDPAHRFQDPAEMLAAVEQQTAAPRGMTAIAPRSAAPTLPPTRLPRRRSSRGLVWGLAAGAVLVALGLVAVLLLSMGGGRAVTTPPPAAATSGLVQVADLSDTPRPTDTAVVIVVTSTPEPTQPPTDTPPPSPSPEPTATETLPPPTEAPSPTSVPPTQAPQSSPTPQEPTSTPVPTSPPAPAVSGRIAYSVGGSLHIVEAATGRALVSPISDARQPDFRRDGNEVIVDGLGNPSATLFSVNANSGAIVRNQTAHTDDYHPSWAPDGSRFAYDSTHFGAGLGLMLYVQDYASGKPATPTPVGYSGQQIRGHSPIWMEDDWLAFTGCDYWPGGSGGSKCGIYRIPSWGETRPAMLYPGSTDMRATDAQGGQLLFMSQETGNWELYIMPAGGGAARNLSNSPGSLDGLGTFSPNGKLVAFASNRGGGWAVWAVATDGSNMAKLFDLPGAPTSPWNEDKISWGP